MAYGRPCATEIDDWNEKLGIAGWSWADLLPYFRRSERLEVAQDKMGDQDRLECPLDPALHGLAGPIHTSIGTWQAPFEKVLLPALGEISGLPPPVEPYGGSHTGFYRSLFTTDRTGKPTRSYAASGYLAPLIGRTNLKIMTNTVVCNVILKRQEDGSLVAKGVNLQNNGNSYAAFANKEIIISAGSVKSPQILELSGIGDPAILKTSKIHCLVPNRNVGSNLQEHTMSAVVYELASGSISTDSVFLDPGLAKIHERLYLESHSGIFSGTTSLTGYVQYSSLVDQKQYKDTIACITERSVSSTGQETIPHQNDRFQEQQRQAIVARMRDPQSPDIQLIGFPANFDIARGRSDCGNLITGPPKGCGPCYTLIVSNMYPVSRGSVHIRSADPNDSPSIDPGFSSHPADVQILSSAVGFADRVFRSSNLRAHVARRVDPPEEVDLQDQDNAQRFIRDRIATYHHMLGTCAMGQVVDDRLRVKGVQGLRVIDASVLPMQISAAIVATVYAVAEKAASMILEDYKPR